MDRDSADELELDQRSGRSIDELNKVFDSWQPNLLTDVIENEIYKEAKIEFLNALGFDNIFTAYASMDKSTRLE